MKLPQKGEWYYWPALQAHIEINDVQPSHIIAVKLKPGRYEYSVTYTTYKQQKAEGPYVWYGITEYGMIIEGMHPLDTDELVLITDEDQIAKLMLLK